MLFLVVALPDARSAPGFLELRSYSVPLVVELPAQSLLEFVLVLREAPPWFLTQRKVGGEDLLEGAGAAVLTVVLARHALAVDDVVDGAFVPRVVGHLIVDAMIELDRLTLIENVVKVGDYSLESHRPVKDTTFPAPSAVGRKVPLSDDFDEFVVDVHVGSQDQKSTLDGLEPFLFGSSHVDCWCYVLRWFRSIVKDATQASKVQSIVLLLINEFGSEEWKVQIEHTRRNKKKMVVLDYKQGPNELLRYRYRYRFDIDANAQIMSTKHCTLV